MKSDALLGADHVIVGGGAAGCVLAARLSEDPSVRVLLLEAGRRDSSAMLRVPGGLLPLMLSGAHAWPYASEPQRALDDRVLYLPRGKVLGGGSSINGMVYDRGFASDYDAWAAAGNTGWSYREVLPFFRRSERWHGGANDWHGAEGPIAVSRPGLRHPFASAFVEAGMQAGFRYEDDSNGATRDGFGPVDVTVDAGVRASASRAYLRPALARPNLRVLTDVLVTRILFEGTRAIGVEFLERGRLRCARADREVLLSAGAINTPQLLLLSGVGAPEELTPHGIRVHHALPGVGRGLQDHLAVVVKYASTQPISLFKYFAPWRGALALAEYLLARRGPLADPGMQAVAFVRSDPALAEPDIKLLLVMALYANHGRTLSPRHGFAAHTNVIRPASRGSVRLAGADAMMPPRIDLNYLADAADLRTARQSIRVARRVFAQRAFDGFRGEELEPGPSVQDDAALDAFIRARADADYHSTSTCRMGADAGAVVDARLRVHGLESLRIVDASVMPRLVGGNTCMPVVMIAEKAAAMISENC